MRVAVLGGSFNPIHMGHLVIANEVMLTLRYDKVIFVPAFTPPHKEEITDVRAEDRLEMTRLATEDNERFLVESYEIEKGGLSYTIDTMDHLYEKYPEIEGEIGLIVGDDLIDGLPLWHKADELVKRIDFIVVTRESDGISEMQEKMSYDATYCVVPSIGISSTMIRTRFHEGVDSRYLLPDKVYRFIKENKLYAK